MNPNDIPKPAAPVLPADYALPDALGRFGSYGGIYVAETLMTALDELRQEYDKARLDPQFQAEFRHELKHYVGRPSPIYHARHWSESWVARRSS